VELIRDYSKRPDLGVDLKRARYRLAKAVEADKPHERLSAASTGRAATGWRVSDRLTDEDVAAIVERGREGVSKVKIAEAFGISHSSVKRILKAHGISIGSGNYKR
jgi:DNA invertase Pin-like site-specific DNA recombinase